MRAAALLFLTIFNLAIHAQTDNLPALAPAYREMPPTFWEQYGTLVIIGVFTLLILAILIFWKLVAPKPAVVLPPEIVARQSLEKLKRQPEDGKTLSEISQILRRYVSEAFNLPNHELTTAEFSSAIESNQPLGAELAGTISSFLRECDVRKFSPPNNPESINAASRALDLVARVEERSLRSAPVPGAATLQTQNVVSKQQAPQSSDVAASGDGRTP